MLKFIGKKFLTFIPTFIGVTIVAFSFIRLIPGDPLIVMAGERGISDERYAELSKQFGFDQPIYVQYWEYLKGVLHGDLGTSFSSKKPVTQEFFELFPATIELAICAMIFAVVLGIPAGVIAASYRGKFFDRLTMTAALIGFSMPIFWLGMQLQSTIAANVEWVPVSGRISSLYYFPDGTGFMLIDSALSNQSGAFASAVSHLFLPTIVLGTIPLAVIARQTRSAMLEVLSEDYIRTARAKGLAPFRVNMVHALRNALIPVVTTIGLLTGTLLAGAILTETVFAWPGIGKWMVESISRRDYPIVQGGLLIIAVIIMIVNFIVDILYGFINPKIRDSV